MEGFTVPNVPAFNPIFGKEFHQVAMYTKDLNRAVEAMRMLGYNDWHEDTADLDGFYVGKKCRIQARMAFNYQMLPGKELEFVEYFDHPDDRYRDLPAGPFISHMSVYVDDVEKAVLDIDSQHGMLPFHEFETSGHTNPRVAGKKSFKEAIYNFRQSLGFNIKLIEKVLEQS